LSGLQERQDTRTGKASANSAEVFSQLYEENFPKVYRYICYQVTDTDAAEDLTSEVWEKALNKFESYDSRRAAFSTWVLTIARNTVTDFFRENRKQQNMQIQTIRSIQPDPPPDEAVVKDEEIRQLKTYIAGLSRQEQEIISFKFGGELTNREIAKNLGLSESNVAVIIYRAVRKLREQFLGAEI
jgi:RNA polymerase sigma-70 factor (ECF subfamily)